GFSLCRGPLFDRILADVRFERDRDRGHSGQDKLPSGNYKNPADQGSPTGSTAVAGTMNFKAWLNTLAASSHTLPIVILYVTEGCNLRCCMCSYRKARPDELSIIEIERLACTLADYGLRHIVFSGGEPLLRRDFPAICKIFSQYGVQETLLTNGLLLDKRLHEIRTFLTEIIVSLDGATAGTHDTI